MSFQTNKTQLASQNTMSTNQKSASNARKLKKHEVFRNIDIQNGNE